MDVQITDPLVLNCVIGEINKAFEKAYEVITDTDPLSQTYKRKLQHIKSILQSMIKSKLIMCPNEKFKENIPLQLKTFNPRTIPGNSTDYAVLDEKEKKYKNVLKSFRERAINAKEEEIVQEDDTQKVLETDLELTKLQEINLFASQKTQEMALKLSTSQKYFSKNGGFNESEKAVMVQIVSVLSGI